MIVNRQKEWTSEEEYRLRILWEAEWSVNAIASTLGRSRGSITGKAARIGLSRNDKAPFPHKVNPNRFRETQAGLEAAREELARAA